MPDAAKIKEAAERLARAVSDAAKIKEAAERLARIRRLWDELSVTRKETAQYRVLIKRIRAETDVFRQAIGDEPQR